jgi:Common central domain of tyrosinase
MAISRRHFFQIATIGPLVFLYEPDPADAQQCGIPGTGQCTLPSPPPATQFIPNEPRVITRYSTLEMNTAARATQLKWLRDGICAIRNLPGTDVISWTKYIAQHCTTCAPSNANNIHYNWQFLPWHRGLLYFLERTMRRLTNQDDTRLCYWNWENASSRVLPAIYAPTNQPLYWSNRGNLSGSQWPLAPYKVNVQPLLALTTFRLFGGTAAQRNPVPATFSGPHAEVHNNFSPGDMSDLQYSPRDPVFYAHHGNIDRLWSSWAAIAGHTNADFGTARVYFYDETRKWRFVLMNDLRDTRKLGYQYSSLMQPTAANLRATVTAKTGNRVTIAPALREAVQKAGPDFLAIANIRNLDQFSNAVRFGVFVGNPPAGTDATRFAGFLGTASRVRSGGHVHGGPLSASLEVTDRLGAQAAQRGGTLDLHVAPLDDNLKTTAAAIPLEADEVHVITQ